MNTNPDPTPRSNRPKPTIIPSAVFAGSDLGWELWTSFVEQLDWTTPESADKARKASFYKAAGQFIDKERALSFVYSWIVRHTDLAITEKKLRAGATAAYKNTKATHLLKAAGKDASPEGVKSEKLRAAVIKKEWTPKTMSEDIGKTVRYSRRLKMSPEACQGVIESHWTKLGMPFDSEELRKRIAEEP